MASGYMPSTKKRGRSATESSEVAAISAGPKVPTSTRASIAEMTPPSGVKAERMPPARTVLATTAPATKTVVH